MSTKFLLLPLFVLFLFSACAKKHTTSKETELATEKQTHTKKVLVFTKTLGWRHKSIETGVATIKDFGNTHNFVVEHTEDSTHFSTAFLPQYDAIIFLSTTGNVLDDDAQKKFEKYIQGGGSYLGIHAAADTEYDWPWYGKLVGGYFESHPMIPILETQDSQKRQINTEVHRISKKAFQEKMSGIIIKRSISILRLYYNWMKPATKEVLTVQITLSRGIIYMTEEKHFTREVVIPKNRIQKSVLESTWKKLSCGV